MTIKTNANLEDLARRRHAATVAAAAELRRKSGLPDDDADRIAAAAVDGILNEFRLEPRDVDYFRLGFEAQSIVRNGQGASAIGRMIVAAIEAMGCAIVPTQPTDDEWAMRKMQTDVGDGDPPDTRSQFADDTDEGFATDPVFAEALPETDAIAAGHFIAVDHEWLRRKLAGEPTVDDDYPTPPVAMLTNVEGTTTDD